MFDGALLLEIAIGHHNDRHFVFAAIGHADCFFTRTDIGCLIIL